MHDSGTQEIVAALGDIRGLLQIGLRDQIDRIKEEVFSSEGMDRAYWLFHEGKSQREIGRELKVSKTTVARWIDGWRNEGLVHPTDARCIVTPEALRIGKEG